MRITCCITKATVTPSNVLYLLLFQCNSGYANAPQCYVIPTLLALLIYDYKSVYILLSRFPSDRICKLVILSDFLHFLRRKDSEEM